MSRSPRKAQRLTKGGKVRVKKERINLLVRRQKAKKVMLRMSLV